MRKLNPDGFADRMQQALAAAVPDGADPGEAAQAVIDIVGRRQGRRPLRVFVDPANEGAAATATVMDRVREQSTSASATPTRCIPAEHEARKGVPVLPAVSAGWGPYAGASR